MRNKKILLHTCCAPCIAYVNELLSHDAEVSIFYLNPNISPESEYLKRLSELKNFSRGKGLMLIEGEYDSRSWTREVKDYRFLGERSMRCEKCIGFRLHRTFEKAVEMGMDMVASTLTISPHKDSAMINRLGKDMEEKYKVEFLQADFKKKDGYRKSVEISRELGFYRQNYCGCIYSKMERDSNSIWMRKAALNKPLES